MILPHKEITPLRLQVGVGTVILLLLGRPTPGSLSALLVGIVAGVIQAGFTVIVAVMQANGLTNLASNDADFDRIPGLTRYAPL